MSEWFQIGVIGFIVLTIGWHALRTARANPENTGTLGKEVAKIGNRVATIDTRLGDIEDDVKRLDSEAASKADIRKLEKEVAGLRSELAQQGKDAASRESTLDHVKQTVDRMLDIIMHRGL